MKLSCYLNGELISITIGSFSSIPSTNGGSLFIGDLDATHNYPFNGILDEIFIYNRTLTPYEVLRLYRFDVPTSQPTATPSGLPTSQPSRKPSNQPTTRPTSHPTRQPTSFISGSLQQGIVAYYPFDGNARDQSGNSNNGFASNVILTTDRFGNLYSAYQFNGFSSYIEVPNGSPFDFSSNMSVAFWVKANHVQNPQSTILDKTSAFAPESSWWIQQNITYLYFSYRNPTLQAAVSSGFWLPRGQWTHYAVTKQNGLLNLYINGNVVWSGKTSANFNIALSGNFPLIIGARNGARTRPASGLSNFFNGTLDEIFIFNRTLMSHEIDKIVQFDAPTSRPTCQPTGQPTHHPSTQPISQPSLCPISPPSTQPSCQPTSRPSAQPSTRPSAPPLSQPTGQPTSDPTAQPSVNPTAQPTQPPTGHPITQPSSQPSNQPVSQPSTQPTCHPTSQPTCLPSSVPSLIPTCQPSGSPSRLPSAIPSAQPSSNPSSQPTGEPSNLPTTNPTTFPSSQPTTVPSAQPSLRPTCVPTSQPSKEPTAQPINSPSGLPTVSPSGLPTVPPTSQPSEYPSVRPFARPSNYPTSLPTSLPTLAPTAVPRIQPSDFPSALPSNISSTEPTNRPTSQLSQLPSSLPTSQPSTQPSLIPSAIPTNEPSNVLADNPTTRPQSSLVPKAHPTAFPSSRPTAQPYSKPSSKPSGQPSRQPISQPISLPTSQPTSFPSVTKNIILHGWTCLLGTQSAGRQIEVLENNDIIFPTDTTFPSTSLFRINSSNGNLLGKYSLPWNQVITLTVHPSSISFLLIGISSKDTYIGSGSMSNNQLNMDYLFHASIEYSTSIIHPYYTFPIALGQDSLNRTVATLFNPTLSTFASFSFPITFTAEKIISNITNPSCLIVGYGSSTYEITRAQIGLFNLNPSPNIAQLIELIPTNYTQANSLLISTSVLVPNKENNLDVMIAGAIKEENRLVSFLSRLSSMQFLSIVVCAHLILGCASFKDLLFANNKLYGICSSLESPQSFSKLKIVRLNPNTCQPILPYIQVSGPGNITCSRFIQTTSGFIINCNLNENQALTFFSDENLTFYNLPSRYRRSLVGGLRTVDLDLSMLHLINQPVRGRYFTPVTIRGSYSSHPEDFTQLLPESNRHYVPLPSRVPTHLPTFAPSNTQPPSITPSTHKPTIAPFLRDSSQPTISLSPTSLPSTSQPTRTYRPTYPATTFPTGFPTSQPSPTPSLRSSSPSGEVTFLYPISTLIPTQCPSNRPINTRRPNTFSRPPSPGPSHKPVKPTAIPTSSDINFNTSSFNSSISKESSLFNFNNSWNCFYHSSFFIPVLVILSVIILLNTFVHFCSKKNQDFISPNVDLYPRSFTPREAEQDSSSSGSLELSSDSAISRLRDVQSDSNSDFSNGDSSLPSRFSEADSITLSDNDNLLSIEGPDQSDEMFLIELLTRDH